MDFKKFKLGVVQLAEEKGIPEEKMWQVIETAMAAAYKKDYGKKDQKIIAKIDIEANKLDFWQVKEVVDKDMLLSEEEIEERVKKAAKTTRTTKTTDEERKVRFNSERHILLKDARRIKPEMQIGDEFGIPLETRDDYGRIAAQTAKQVILQKLKELEREILLDEYKTKEGEIISGTVQRTGRKEVFFDIGKLLGVLPKDEQIPGEFYKLGQRFKLYVLKVEPSPKGPLVFLSRAFPKFISKLFELEVPEIANGEVEIKSIAREPGSRTKIAMKSNSEEIDPIGAAVGQRGTRVMAVISELGGEKIDIVEYSENPEEYIAYALSPAKVLEVRALPKNVALCIVPEDQLSLAIGREGQNVRLAAKLTGWKIDVRSPQEKEPKEKRIAEKPKEAEKKVGVKKKVGAKKKVDVKKKAVVKKKRKTQKKVVGTKGKGKGKKEMMK